MEGSPPTLTPTPTPAPANNEPQFAAENAARSVPENSTAGESVGDPVTASDGDDDALTYALTGSDDFTVNKSGQIMVATGATLDYETTPSYSMTITSMTARMRPARPTTALTTPSKSPSA